MATRRGCKDRLTAWLNEKVVLNLDLGAITNSRPIHERKRQLMSIPFGTRRYQALERVSPRGLAGVQKKRVVLIGGKAASAYHHTLTPEGPEKWPVEAGQRPLRVGNPAIVGASEVQGVAAIHKGPSRRRPPPEATVGAATSTGPSRA